MRYHRLHTSGRRPRRARLVDLRQRALPSLHGEAAQMFVVGLEAAQLLKQHFPDFYAQHAGSMTCAPENLLGCAAAFWQLWKNEGLLLRLPGDEGWYGDDCIEFEATPEETLRSFADVAVEFMNTSIAHFLVLPRPNYFGLGVESWLETEDGPDLLTATLWRLFQGTHWSIIDMDDPKSGSYSDVDPELAELIAQLTPLPQNANLAAIAGCVTLPGAPTDVSAFDLLAYAVGQTENTLANHNDYDVEAIHMGELDEEWHWDHARTIIELQREARALEHAYGHWANWLCSDARHHIPLIASALYAANRVQRRKATKRSKDETLITMLAEAGMLAEVSA